MRESMYFGAWLKILNQEVLSFSTGKNEAKREYGI